MPARVIIGGDFVPTESNYALFKEEDVDSLVGEKIWSLLNKADFTAFNLEVPLTNQAHPIEKCGPNLIAPIYTIKGLRAINPHFFGIANNHILDQGEEGLKSTVDVLDRVSISHAGAGKNLTEAERPFLKEIKGIMVGIYCCAEHEFSIATESTCGANPFDPLESLDHVAKLKKQTDYVIVLYHGGKEHYRYPSPQLQKTCRKLIDKGADLVVCQHSHCIGAAEEWNGGTIVYGQGNFLFDHNDSEFWQTGLLIEVVLKKEAERTNAAIKYIPLRKNHEKVRMAEGSDAEQIKRKFKSRSDEIKDPAKVQEEYDLFARTMLHDYLFNISGKKSLLFRALNKASGYKLTEKVIRNQFDLNTKEALLDYIDCEAHRELLSQGLRRNLK